MSTMKRVRNLSALIVFVLAIGLPRAGLTGPSCYQPPLESWCSYWLQEYECSYWGYECYSPTNDCYTAPCNYYASQCQMSATCAYDQCGYSWCQFEGPRPLGS